MSRHHGAPFLTRAIEDSLLQSCVGVTLLVAGRCFRLHIFSSTGLD